MLTDALGGVITTTDSVGLVAETTTTPKSNKTETQKPEHHSSESDEDQMAQTQHSTTQTIIMPAVYVPAVSHVLPPRLTYAQVLSGKLDHSKKQSAPVVPVVPSCPVIGKGNVLPKRAVPLMIGKAITPPVRGRLNRGPRTRSIQGGKTPLPFLSLPREIRDLIYECILDIEEQDTWQNPEAVKAGHFSPSHLFNPSLDGFSVTRGVLLLVNKQVRFEYLESKLELLAKGRTLIRDNVFRVDSGPITTFGLDGLELTLDYFMAFRGSGSSETFLAAPH